MTPTKVTVLEVNQNVGGFSRIDITTSFCGKLLKTTIRVISAMMTRRFEIRLNPFPARVDGCALIAKQTVETLNFGGCIPVITTARIFLSIRNTIILLVTIGDETTEALSTQRTPIIKKPITLLSGLSRRTYKRQERGPEGRDSGASRRHHRRRGYDYD